MIKRSVTFLSMIVGLIAFCLTKNMLVMSLLLIPCVMLIQSTYRLFSLMLILLLFISFFIHSIAYETYMLSETTDVLMTVKDYGGYQQGQIKNHKILIKREELLLPGTYKVTYEHNNYFNLNPNTFKYEYYLRSCGFVDVITDEAIFVAVQVNKAPYLRKVKAKLNASKYSGYYLALIFADKSTLEADIFHTNGTAHILAISGLHIGLLYGMIYGLSRPLKKHRRIIALGVVLVYIAFIDMPVSSVRAWCMLTMSYVATTQERRYDVLQTLSFIALILIIKNPYVIYHTGFQYSFAAVLVIEVIFKQGFRHIKSKPLKIILLPVLIQLCLLPLTLYHQNTIHLLSFLINIMSVFMIAWLLYFLVAYLLTGMDLILSLTDVLFESLLWINNWFNQLTYFKLELPSPPLLFVCMFYMLCMLWFEEKIKKIVRATVLILCVIYTLFIICVVEVTFLDIGQGDAVLIRSGFDYILIDGGQQTKNNVLKEIILKQGFFYLDDVILSHSDSDHIGGLIDLEDHLIEATMYYQAPNQKKPIFNEVNCKKSLMSYKSWGAVSFKPVLYNVGKSYNDASLIGYLEAYGVRIFFSGDIEAYVENQLTLEDIDILKVPHHGSNTSSTESFIKQLSPEHAVICVGRNSYGHPHKDVIERYESKGISVYQTWHGYIKVYILPWGDYKLKQPEYVSR